MFPKQIRQNINIINLPNEIVCWISSILEGKTVKKEQHNNLPINQRHTLENEKIFAPKQVSKIDSWVCYQESKESKSYVPLQQQSGGITLE